ncbi:MAG TPA: ferredoxin [Acidimicrobiales bacterium]|nr:ferredoxin [Acidimicrobiales bacterium]
MRIVVDFDLCQSNGQCTRVAPTLFEVRDDGFLYVLDESPDAGLRGLVEEAIEACPTAAISVSEE